MDHNSIVIRGLISPMERQVVYAVCIERRRVGVEVGRQKRNIVIWKDKHSRSDVVRVLKIAQVEQQINK